MGETAATLSVSGLISYCDDLVRVLQNEKDIGNLMHCTDNLKYYQSSCDSKISEVQNSLAVYQKKIDECQQRINDAKSDAELDSLQKEYEEELNRESSLHEELRIVSDKINDLEQQRVSLEEREQNLKKADEDKSIERDKINDLEQQRVSLKEREQNLKKADKDKSRERRMLSMYASVTNVIPNMDVGTKISGRILKREKRAVEMFEFETTNSSSIEMCNYLWKMIDSRELY